ncbi:hypothetical protein FPV67DRAFT_1784455 [Lyophyllum atratum]|nr:hypothetical protein FPV67DRAFT_1784455 [Lyophyllum atratum]
MRVTVQEPLPLVSLDPFPSEFSGPMHELRVRTLQEQERQEREDYEFDINLGHSPSPIPPFNEFDNVSIDEDADLRLAVQLSLSQSPIPATEQNTASSSSTTLPSFSTPRRRVPPSSVVEKQVRAPNKITTQMSESWAREYVDNTSAPVLHQPQKRRPFMDLSVVRRFTLIFWDKDGEPANISVIQECPDWPNWRLTTAPETLQILGEDTKRRMKRESDSGSQQPQRRRARLMSPLSDELMSSPSTPSGSISQPISLVSPLPAPPNSQPWPHGLYAVDMVHGFLKMGDPETVKSFPSMPDRFKHVYGCDYRKSTYGDQQRRWRCAPESLRTAVLAAKKTAPGLWSVVQAEVPLK